MAERPKVHRLEDLADSVLDGREVDWDAAESSTSEPERRLIRQLRLVSVVAEVHRSADAAPASSPQRHHLLELPSRRGPLEVLEQIGHGSFGDVYRAWDPRLDREVALKLLDQNDADANASSQVVEEGRLLARIRHPNVVAIYGADRIDGRVGIWMELVRGRTLERILKEEGPFSPAEIVRVGVDLCRALTAVHRAGVLHRDVKAQNVIREEDGRIVLMDFGTGGEDRRTADDDSLSGTPLYLAPELFRGAPATPCSDIYSAGVVLFHIACGFYPVAGRSINDLRAAHRDGARVSLRDQGSRLTEPLISVIERALDANAATRYQTGGEMEGALLDAAGSIQPAGVEVRKRRAFGLVTATAIAAAIGIGTSALGPKVVRGLRSAFPTLTRGSGSTTIATTSELTARRVTLPQTMYMGRPSPDGRYLTYVDLDGDLCAYDFARTQGRKLTRKRDASEWGESQIAVSTNGKWIAYAWHTTEGSNEIRVIDEGGTSPRTLFRRADVLYPNPLQWSADGHHILATLELKTGERQLALISSQDGATTLLRTLPGGQYYPTLSPDGNLVAIDEPEEKDPRSRDIFVLSVRDPGESPRPIIEHPANDMFPMWLPDGRLLFVSDRTGSLGLWASDGEGEPDLLARDVGRLAMPLGLTRTGSLYYYLQNGMVDVYTQSIDLLGSGASGVPIPVAPTLMGSNISSEWSPDGRFLAYVSMQGLVQNDRYSRTLVIRDASTGRTRDLQPSLGFFIGPRWSPDGRAILVTGTDLNSRSGMFVVDVATGRTTPAFLSPPDTVQSAIFQWSPDGDAVWRDKPGARAIVSRNLTSGAEEIVLDYGSESIVRLMQWPGFRISPDGRSIAYTGATVTDKVPGTVVRVRALGGGSHEIARATGADRVEVQDWTPDGDGLLIVKRNTERKEAALYEAPLDGSPHRALGIAMEGLRDLGLRRDGKAVTYTAGMNTLEVWMLENFLERDGNRHSAGAR